MTQYKWLLLDADNTLFDFNAAEEFALNRTLIRYGAPVSDEIKAGYRRVNTALWQAHERGEISQDALVVKRFRVLQMALGISGDPAEWNTFYLDSLADCPTLIPGAEALCRRLSDRYILALTTNGVPYVQRRRLERSPLRRYFGDRVFISGEMGCQKPQKLYFDTVLNALGARTQRGLALVIGDSLTSDIQGAFNARLDSVWLHWPSAKPGVLKPTYEVENLTQLAQLLNAGRFVPLDPDQMFRS